KKAALQRKPSLQQSTTDALQTLLTAAAAYRLRPEAGPSHAPEVGPSYAPEVGLSHAPEAGLSESASSGWSSDEAGTDTIGDAEVGNEDTTRDADVVEYHAMGSRARAETIAAFCLLTTSKDGSVVCHEATMHKRQAASTTREKAAIDALFQ
ncbi:hypothetical protein T484DRAFT_1824433, partial [Baffinella frigidus]